MADVADVDSHEIYVWNADDLLEAVKGTKETMRRAVEANDKS